VRGYLGIFVMAAFLTGCASGPLGGQALTDNVKSSAARLVIYRSSAMGFAVQPDYVVDGRVVAGSQPAGFVVCDLLGHGSERVNLDLRAGSTAYLSAEPQIGILTPARLRSFR
jgi:hypothetical protein